MLLKSRAFVLSALCAGSLWLGSCEQQKPAAAAPETPAATARPDAVPAVEAGYVCPMGCTGSESAKPGKCPTCKMNLEKKA